MLSPDSICKSIKWSSIWLETVAEKLKEDNVLVSTKGGYSLIGINPNLTKQDLIKINNIESIIQSSGMVPISVTQIIQSSRLKPKRVRDLIHLLLNENKIISLSNDFYVHRYYMNNVLIKIREFFLKRKNLSVSEFKNITGLTRKTAIPFLEYLDTNNFTVRNENYRSIGESLNDK